MMFYFIFSWRRYLEDEDDSGCLVDPKSWFEPDKSEINISPIPLAQTLGRLNKRINGTTGLENNYSVTPNQCFVPMTAQLHDSAIADDTAVLESLNYFSNLSSKVNDAMQHGDRFDCLQENTSNGQVDTISKGSGEPSHCVTVTPSDNSKSLEPDILHALPDMNVLNDETDLFSVIAGKCQLCPVAQTCGEHSQELVVLKQNSDVGKYHHSNNLTHSPDIKEQSGNSCKDSIGTTDSSAMLNCDKLGKGDSGAIKSEDEIVTQHWSIENGKIRQTNSLSNVENCSVSKENATKTPRSKRQRSATCLIEHETVRRKF